jgi:hypothetical protein
MNEGEQTFERFVYYMGVVVLKYLRLLYVKERKVKEPRHWIQQRKVKVQLLFKLFFVP